MSGDSRSARLSQSLGGMLLTIFAVLGIILVIAFFTFRPADNEVKVVDYQTTATAARQAGAFPVAVPSPVPSSWKATSVTYTPSAINPKIATWHLGFFIEPNDYVGIEQTNGSDPGFLKEATAQGKPDGQSQVAGQTWNRYYSDSTGHRSLVSQSNGVTTVVTGTLSYADLGNVAASLKTS